MDSTAGTLPRGGIVNRSVVLVQALHVIGSRANVTAEQRARPSTVQTSVQIQVRIETAVFGDLDVLVTHHVGLVDDLTPGYDAVGLVESKRTLSTLEEIRMAGMPPPTNTLTPDTNMKRARKAARLSPVKREKPVSLDARQMIEL